MKKLIILPGNSVKNKEWGKAVYEYYGKEFDTVYMQFYDHWENGQLAIDFEKEIKKLQKEISKNSKETSITIFAKSAGSILAIMATNKIKILPSKSIFFGMPLDWACKEVFDNDLTPLKNFNIPTIAFHNDKDPIASYEFTKDIIENKSNGNIKLVTTKGSDHGYFDFTFYDDFLERV